MIALPVITITCRSVDPSSQVSDCIVITIDFYVGGKCNRAFRDCDWNTFFSVLSVLDTRYARIAMLNIGFKDLVDQEKFFEDNVPSSARAVLERMLSEGKVCCGYWNAHSGGWTEVFDDRPLGLGELAIFSFVSGDNT